jgi:gamma-glutamyltranspeptidase/glutathione hydrolase
LLNNEMGDFNWKPGRTDRSGTIGTAPNLIEPGKRMLSSQTPTIVSKDGQVLLVTGSPGGRTIVNTVLQVILNVIEFDMDLASAVDAPRLHHQWLPDQVVFERRVEAEHPDLMSQLRAMGHTIGKPVERQGDAHSIWVAPKTGQRHGVADLRLRGCALGY